MTEQNMAQPIESAVNVPNTRPLIQVKAYQGEKVLWYGYNPTFHRFLDYGLVLTSTAFYLYRRN
jgi:hypothetical protein